MVLVLLAVARPALFRPRLIVLNFTVPVMGAPLMAVTFGGAAALGIGGTRCCEAGRGGRVRWQILACVGAARMLVPPDS